MAGARHALRAAALAALALGAACGGPRDQGGPPAAGPEVAHRAEAAGRTVVATVEGEPVYDDCVIRQAEAGALSREEALDQCIAFELLAQEALRRGYQGDEDVLEARKIEMVRGLVASEFVPTIDDPSDIPDRDLEELWDRRLRSRYNKPERRAATYCRVPVDRKAPRDGEEDQAARTAADRLHRATRHIQFTPELLALTCQLASGGIAIDSTIKPTNPFSATGRHARGMYQEDFVRAAYSVPAIGQVSGPTRTRWGWDLVLVTEILPAEQRSLEDAAPEIREELLNLPDTAPYRIGKFERWLGRYLAQARIEVDLSALESDGELVGQAEAARPRPGAEAGGR
jgi:hypothetical protein